MWRFYFWPNHPRSRPPLATQARLGYVTPQQAERVEAACQVESRGICVWRPECIGHRGRGVVGRTKIMACANGNDLWVSEPPPPYPPLPTPPYNRCCGCTSFRIFFGGNTEHKNGSCREPTLIRHFSWQDVKRSGGTCVSSPDLGCKPTQSSSNAARIAPSAGAGSPLVHWNFPCKLPGDIPPHVT